jgi:predicted AlkP superfamily phosphohydrolase/phosphomutase
MSCLRRCLAFILLAWLLTGGVGCERSEPELSPPTGDRVVLIGVDAATWDVMRPLMAAGDLPNFRGLVERGWSGVLRSMEPMVSPALWTTIASGHPPSVHGISGFLAPTQDGASAPVTSNLRRVETLWTIATRAGRTVNVIGWFVTWPAEPINGVMVSDRIGPQRENDPYLGGADVSTEHPGVTPISFMPTAMSLIVRPEDFPSPAERKFHEEFRIYPVDATRTAIAEYALSEMPADLTMIYLWGVDPTQHWFWKYHDPAHWIGLPIPKEEMERIGDPVSKYYRDTDEFLGRILAKLRPSDTIIVVSDHGAGPVTKYDPKKANVSGDHRIDGIIIAAGPPIRHGTAAEPPGLLDLTPSVLYLLGLPAGRDMPGRVITEMLTPEWMRAHPERRVATWERGNGPADRWPIVTKGDQHIKEKLRSLGYLQ